MATRDPVLDELRRSMSLSATSSRKTGIGLAVADSTISLEGLEQADIDALVNRRWQIEEIIGLVRSRIAFLSGGRDRRGAPIITIHGSEHTDFRPSNLAKLLSYLSKVADERLQGLGFTVILDMRQSSWAVMKKALKSLQLTFVEHVHRVLLIKPRAFWQRQRAGVNFTLTKAKFNYPIVMLESSTDLFHHLQVSEITRDLGGTLDYDHDQWIQIQRSLEKHQVELEGRLEEFEVLREQLGQLEHLDNLNEARDAVRRHVEAKQRLDKGELDTISEKVSHVIARMQPCHNPDFQACFGRLEDHCSSLQVTRGQLERLWEEKGTQLDRILQLRVFEHDSEQLGGWIKHEAASLAHSHTDIGDSLSTAELRRQSFEDFRTRMKMKQQELSRVCTMGERLTAANHYATEVFRSHGKELKGSWDSLTQMADDRATLFSLSVSFHDKQQKFFQRVEGWLDECMEKHFPDDVEKAEALLSKHGQLKETYQELYASARQDGHKIIDRLKRPVGEGSLPTPFVIGTRHIKEILESLFDERNWLDEQWQRRQLILSQALNLRKYQKEAKKVYSWLSDVGNPFLTSSNGIGSDSSGAQTLLKSHDQFEGDSHGTYSLASQLFARGKELSASGECNPDMIEEEAESLESSVSIFATRLDERREIILHSEEYHNKMKALSDEFSRLSAPVPRGDFNGSTNEIEPRLSSFLASWSEVRSKSSAAFRCCQDLVRRLQDAEKSAKSAGSSVSYSSAVESIERRLEEGKSLEWKVREVCLKREKRWKLALQFNQLEPNVDKYLVELESWTQEQEHVEWEPAENTMDAQLHLDAFQRQYDQLVSSHDELFANGRSISKEVEQLDSEMFGSTVTGHAHPLTSKVEELIEKMRCSMDKMLEIASPKLQQLNDCLQFHLLQQRAKKLTMALATLSFSLSNLNGVGHTLDSARSLNQQASQLNDKLKGVGGDVDGFSHEVEDCISRGHYQAPKLGKLARSLQEKKGAISRHAMERHRVISASVEFQQNVKNLSASMDNCHTQFSSKETGSTVSDNEKMIKNLEELKTFIEQAAEEVQSLGKKLLELLLQTKDIRKVNSTEGMITLSRTPRSRRRINASSAEISNSPKPHRVALTAESANIRLLNGEDEDAKPLARASSLDLLNSTVNDEESDATSTAVSRLDCPHSPRLLVTPRKKSAGVKSSAAASNHDQLMIEGVLLQMERRLDELKLMWERRQRKLKQSQKVVEFREAVPTVTDWVEQVGDKFVRGKHKHNLGRSIEEVKSLIAEGEEFERNEVMVMSEKVRQLQSIYKSVEEAGSHAFLNELRALNASLINKWEEFENSLATHMSNLDLSLKFQETLFEASNWCQKSQSFLNSMEEKGDVCDRSEEVASLVAELSVFINATRTEQMDRVDKLKETSEYLRSNLLSEVAQQISLTTERTMGDFEGTKSSLEKRHSKLVQIEGEKDRERRLTKQRERVIEEILHTEEAYVADLKLVVEKCRPRFVSELLPPSLKGKEGIIFTNVTDIEAFHRIHMLPRLRDLGVDVEGVAELFIENADQLTALYVPFCRDKSAADDLLTSHRSYFDRIQFMFGTDTPLHSLLIKPVQRIAKYPLLMKEALKYTLELNQTSKKLEGAVKAVEKILTVTNNAIHISCLENSKYLVRDLGDLLYQSPLLVSEQSRFGIKAEKERHVFAFDRALLFARKVELGQGAKFKYEHKFNVPLNSSVKVIEFVEGERCKFILTSGDQRLHFKASSLDIKQDWVTALRTAILADGRHRTKKHTLAKSSNVNGNVAVMVTVQQGGGGVGGENGWTRDLREPSPSPSATDVNTAPAAAPKSEFEKCRVTEDYSSGSGSGGHMIFSLSKGDMVEVLDNNIEGKWYVRSLGGSQHGWVPAALLEPLPLNESHGGEDMTDGKGGHWVQIARGPLTSGGGSIEGEEKKFHAKPNQTSFGSRDIQSQSIISALKKVTFDESEEGGENGTMEVVAEQREGEGDEEETSLDRPVVKGERDRSQTLPTLMPGSSSLDVPPSPSHSNQNSRSSPRGSPRGSPRASPRGSPRVRRRGHNEVGGRTSYGGSGSDKEKSPTHLNWTKSQWRRKVIRKRQGSTCRSSSVSSDRSESPGEKMLHSSSSDEAISLRAGKEPTPTAAATDTLTEEGVEEGTSSSSRVSIEIEEEETEKIRKAQTKIKFVMAELVETERQYVKHLSECISTFISDFQSPSLPDALKGKEKLVFGNIQAVYNFHKNTFLQLVEDAKDSIEAMGQCFLDQASGFGVYVPYCENKPLSESFLWKYAHAEGTFFGEVQKKYELREGIDSYLIKPVQRITKYQLLLRELKKAGEKAGIGTGNLEKALQVMQDIPKRANDAMALSMIFGYEGNIHANGRIILQDEFTVYERSRWTAARRHIFLLDQRLIITKEKDSDGMFTYKDSLKVHSLSVAEKEGDNPCRFAVGTGPIGKIDSWDQYYVLEASSPEKKKEWVDALKDILKEQFELLKGLKVSTPKTRPRSKTFDSTSSYPPESESAAMINFSDDSENEEDEIMLPPRRSSKGTSPGPWTAGTAMPPAGTAPRRQTFGEVTPHIPVTQTRSYNLYMVAEDCAPPKDNEGIMYVRKGQIFDIIESKSDWWWARLVRDLPKGSEGICQQGWVPGSFLEKYGGTLSADEKTKINSILRHKKVMKHVARVLGPMGGGSGDAMPNGTAIGGGGGGDRLKSPSAGGKMHEKNKLTITTSMTFQQSDGEEEEAGLGEGLISSDQSGTLKKQKAPRIVSPLSDKTVIVDRSVQLKCLISADALPPPAVEWSKDGLPLNIDRAFTSLGEESCILRIQMVERDDEGTYTCTVANKMGVVSSSAKVTVMSPPDPPSKPLARPLTSTSVRLSWTPPTFVGHSPITMYLVECKDIDSDRWSTIMKRITESSTIVDDLMPGTEYVFRVVAGNQIGSSEPSDESDPFQMPRSPLDTDFSLDPFENHYDLLGEIGRGSYGTVYECVHNTTQQTYAAKLLPLDVGRDHAQHELEMLARVSHPNIVQMMSAYLTHQHFILLFQLIQGVNIFEYFTHHDCLTEPSAAACLEQIVSALCYLHQSNIAHLDIKPENVLAVEVEGYTVPEIKLIHFERSREVNADNDVIIKRLDDHIEYEAPEILLDEPVSAETDMWSLGVLLYTLLGGVSPFLVDSLDLTKDNIVSVRFSFPVKSFREVSEGAKQLCSQLLIREKSKRLSSLQCLRHSWLESNKLLENNQMTRLNISRLKSYVSSRKWQSSLFLEQSQL